MWRSPCRLACRTTTRTVRGILHYATQRGRWAVAVTPELPIVPLSSLRNWSGDGAIVMINTPGEARLVAELGIPAVNVSGAVRYADVPRVMAGKCRRAATS